MNELPIQSQQPLRGLQDPVSEAPQIGGIPGLPSVSSSASPSPAVTIPQPSLQHAAAVADAAAPATPSAVSPTTIPVSNAVPASNIDSIIKEAEKLAAEKYEGKVTIKMVPASKDTPQKIQISFLHPMQKREIPFTGINVGEAETVDGLRKSLETAMSGANRACNAYKTLAELSNPKIPGLTVLSSLFASKSLRDKIYEKNQHGNANSAGVFMNPEFTAITLFIEDGTSEKKGREITIDLEGKNTVDEIKTAILETKEKIINDKNKAKQLWQETPDKIKELLRLDGTQVYVARGDNQSFKIGFYNPTTGVMHDLHTIICPMPDNLDDLPKQLQALKPTLENLTSKATDLFTVCKWVNSNLNHHTDTENITVSYKNNGFTVDFNYLSYSGSVPSTNYGLSVAVTETSTQQELISQLEEAFASAKQTIDACKTVDEAKKNCPKNFEVTIDPSGKSIELHYVKPESGETIVAGINTTNSGLKALPKLLKNDGALHILMNVRQPELRYRLFSTLLKLQANNSNIDVPLNERSSWTGIARILYMELERQGVDKGLLDQIAAVAKDNASSFLPYTRHEPLIEALLTLSECTLKSEEKAVILKKLLPNLSTENILCINGIFMLGQPAALLGDASPPIALQNVVKEKLSLGGIEKFEEKYASTFAASRYPLAIAIYTATLFHYQNTSQAGTESIELLREFVTLVLNGTFKDERYNVAQNPHLQKIKDYDIAHGTQILQKWQESVSLDEQIQPTKDWLISELMPHLTDINGKDSPIMKYLNGTDEQKAGAKKELQLGMEKALLAKDKNKTWELQFQTRLIKYLESESPEEQIKQLKYFKTVAQARKNKEFESAIDARIDASTKIQVFDTDDAYDLLLYGTEGSETCQAINSSLGFNVHLLGCPMNGWNRMLKVSTGINDPFIARSKLTLIWDTVKEAPALYRESLYTNSKNQELAINKMAQKKAEALGVPVLCRHPDYDSEAASPLVVFKGRTHGEYTNDGSSGGEGETYVIYGAEPLTLDNPSSAPQPAAPLGTATGSDLAG